MNISKKNSLKIGLVADLRLNGSIHTETFARAVNYIKSELIHTCDFNVFTTLVSDDADNTGGKNSAEILISENVDVVIGHFYSGAARAALPTYAAHNIPLILPAATSDDLTVGCKNVFRLCPKDNLQAKAIINFIQSGIYKYIDLVSDNSYSSNCLIEKIKASVSIATFRKENEIRDLVIYIGRFTYLPECFSTDEAKCDYLLSDDSFHRKLLNVKRRSLGNVYVVGFSDHENNSNSLVVKSWYKKKFKENHNCYLIETIAAAEIALAAFQEANNANMGLQKALSSKGYASSLGRVEFENGENNAAKYEIWKVSEKAFIKQVTY